jgi:hypothetical protein
MQEVRNFLGYGPYRPAPLRNHEKAKKYFEDLSAAPSGGSPS